MPSPSKRIAGSNRKASPRDGALSSELENPQNCIFQVVALPEILRQSHLGLPSLQKCVCDFLVKVDLEFDLKFGISDGKNLVKFWGRTFLPARKARTISGRISDQISEKISETSFQISQLFSSFSRRAVLTVT